MLSNLENPEVFSVRITYYKEDDTKESLYIQKDKSSSNIAPVYHNTIEILDNEGNKLRQIEENHIPRVLLADQKDLIDSIKFLFKEMFSSVLYNSPDIKNLKVKRRKDFLTLDKPNEYSFTYQGMNIVISIMVGSYIVVSFGFRGYCKIGDMVFDYRDKNVEMLVVGNEDHVDWMLGRNVTEKVLIDYLEFDRRIDLLQS